jgi:hypothetical protein
MAHGGVAQHPMKMGVREMCPNGGGFRAIEVSAQAKTL